MTLERLAERLPRPDDREGLFNATLRDTDRERGERDPRPREEAERPRIALAHRSENGIVADVYIVEEERVGVRRSPSELVVRRCHRHAAPVERNQERGHFGPAAGP